MVRIHADGDSSLHSDERLAKKGILPGKFHKSQSSKRQTGLPFSQLIVRVGVRVVTAQKGGKDVDTTLKSLFFVTG